MKSTFDFCPKCGHRRADHGFASLTMNERSIDVMLCGSDDCPCTTAILRVGEEGPDLNVPDVDITGLRAAALAFLAAHAEGNCPDRDACTEKLAVAYQKFLADAGVTVAFVIDGEEPTTDQTSLAVQACTHGAVLYAKATEEQTAHWDTPDGQKDLAKLIAKTLLATTAGNVGIAKLN